MSYQSLETRIGYLLIENAGLKESDLTSVLALQKQSGKKLGEILIEQKLIRPEDITKALALQLGLPYIEDLKPQEIDPTIVEKLSIQYCRENKVLPLYQTEDFVRVAVSDPFHYEPLDALRILYKKNIDTVLALPQKLDEAINTVFERSDNMIKGLESTEDNYAEDLDETMDLLESTDDEAPVIRFVNSLLFRAIKDKASDIHIEPFEKFVQVRFRIDGILYDVYKAPKNLHAAISSRIKVMAELNIAEKRIPQDGRIKTRLAGREVDIRLSVVPVAAGERLVMRLLDKSSVVLDLPKLGFEEESIKKISELTDRKYGIFLVTGPTGSGKSTTLSACLKNINSPERNIITVEDPIEYQLPGVGQIAVNEKVGLSFASGLRSILRQDPDVVMVGEIRDRETAEIAINASLTGHLVLSTLHTNDAPGAITRLIDMGIEPFLVSSSIVGVLAQRLIRKICPHCSEPYSPTKELVESIGANIDQLKKLSPHGELHFYKSKGCSDCRFTGYVGRMAIYELMVVSDEIRGLILKEVDAGTIRKQSTKEGMLSLRQSALSKLCQGVTTVEEIIRITQLDDS